MWLSFIPDFRRMRNGAKIALVSVKTDIETVVASNIISLSRRTSGLILVETSILRGWMNMI